MPPEGRVPRGEGEPFGVGGRCFKRWRHRKTWEQFCCAGESASAKSGTGMRTGGGGECGRGCS